MATVIQSEFAPARVGGSAAREFGESFADRVLTFAAMGGAVTGAVGGASWGADAGGVLALVCGTLGTMFGSGLASGACVFLARLLAHPADAAARAESDHAEHADAVAR